MNFFFPLLLIFLLPTISLSTDVIAIDLTRSQLLKDALDWMTFRKNAKLLTTADPNLASQFLLTLKSKYSASKHYRAFVIAFQQGVLPRMTLGENQPCDPAYTLEYKHPLNFSVTWYYQKKFTFEKYHEKDMPNLVQFCDYRQGLICKYKTKQCGCPEGAVMTAIESSSPVKRCQLKPNEICALIDLDHGNEPNHPRLQNYLHELVFNLERPPSCQSGSQCRYKQGDSRNYPKCVTGGPWETSISDLDFGDECAIGLLASPGSWKKKPKHESFGYDITKLEGYVCFNHGPPRNLGRNGPGDETKIGFCSTEFGPLGVTQYTQEYYYKKEFDPLFAPFIHPRSVPIHGKALRDFFTDMYDKLWNCFFLEGSYQGQESTAGNACSTSKTAKVEQAWKFFVGLEGTPPAGKEFVATVGEVKAQVQVIVDACQKPEEKFCQVYTYHSQDSHPQPSLKCVAQGSPDANGNDGKCQTPGNVDMTAFDKEFFEYQDIYNFAVEDDVFQHFDERILEKNPEPPCDPHKGRLPSIARVNHPEPVEGNYCPDGSVCFEDYSDQLEFNTITCEPGSWWKQRFVCHEIKGKMHKCEEQFLVIKVWTAIGDLDKHAKLKEGDTCDYQFETLVRSDDNSELYQINPYVVLNRIVIRGAICDKMGRNLECNSGGVCECMGKGCIEKTTEEPITEPLDDYNGTSKKLALTWIVAITFGYTIILHFEHSMG